MTAISTRAHEKFMELIRARTAIETMDNDFLDDSRMLRQIHDQYQEDLSRLRRLVVLYGTVRKRLRAELRKQPAASARQGICV